MNPAIYFTLLLFIPAIFLFFIKGSRRSTKRLPPGSLGIPLIGQSLGLLYAMRKNTAERWVQERIEKYGSISKLTLFGTPTVMIHGQAANKFLFTSDSNTLSNQQPKSIMSILGNRCLFALSNDDHKRVRGALMSFLRPEVLKQYVGKIDVQVRMHLESHWQGKQQITVCHRYEIDKTTNPFLTGVHDWVSRSSPTWVPYPFRGTTPPIIRPILMDQIPRKRTSSQEAPSGPCKPMGKFYLRVLPLMKTLTFNIMCSLLFGLEAGERKDRLVECFQEMMGGMWSVPINLPFTRFNGSLRASSRVQNMIIQLINEKRMALQQQQQQSDHGHQLSKASSLSSPPQQQQDLITSLLSIRDEDNNNNNAAAVLTENEIVDNVRLVMVAGYDTSSVLITFLIRLLAKDPVVYASILDEQEEIAKSKASGELLTWEDLAKMKYTWRVAMETLRMLSPVFGGFRKALKDIEYGGYLIPKGWQIFWSASLTHMDESIFPEPSKFEPSRFDNQVSTVPPYSFVAFGGGPRICPGYEFARIETLTAIHYLVTRFTWKLCGSTDDTFSRDPMPVPSQGLPIEIEPKKKSYTTIA
ncbi:Cytochrome P450 [Macleaya cordata]|uniref:Cytochrome P450 n=1 Tax=Macleaya cordata TaxID=56857 RepID=A0A200Q6J2_MACCD|nr:Cytochrome P450 [Macleaya cordata]